MVEALAVIFGSDISPARTWRTSKWAANYGGPILRSLAIWIVPRRLDRLLVQPRLSDLLVQPVRLSPLGPGGQVVQLARLLREDPAARRDLGHLYRLSDRVDRLVLQSSQRAPRRLRAQWLSRYAYRRPQAMVGLSPK